MSLDRILFFDWLISKHLTLQDSVSKIDVELLLHSSPPGGCLMGKLAPWGYAPTCCSLGEHLPLPSASLSSGVGVGMCVHLHVYMPCLGLFHSNHQSLFLYTLLNGGN